MITSLSWIKNHLSTKANLKQVVERLTEIGLEVESVKSPGNVLDSFIICKVIKSQKHPNADKLKICDVDIGKGDLIKVVCGAPNAREGLFTVYAPPETIIPSFLFLKNFLFFKTAASGRAHDGSHTIFSLSHIIFIDLIISFSVILIIE